MPLTTVDSEGQSKPTFSTFGPDYRVLVCQLGAREHYLVARSLARLGLLSCLATDFWRPAGQSQGLFLRRSPKVVLAAMARYHPELEGQYVASFPSVAIARYCISKFDEPGAHDEIIAKYFARRVKNARIRHDVFFGYSYDSLELLREERRNGVFTILGQTDPGPEHYRMVHEEETQWPKYSIYKSRQCEQARAERLRQEWNLADVVIANSAWTKDSIVSAGAPASKIEILPLAYTPPVSNLRQQQSGNGRLKVLWVASVALGKGIQYLVEAARMLLGEPVEFLVAGDFFISSKAINTAPKNMRWLGRIPRSAVSKLYNECDVFVFPTLSDGFGLTQLEAMAHSLPVITTPNCGKVVEEGKTGFLIPPRDPQALADAVLCFVRNPRLAREMASACREAVKAFSLETYSHRLLEIIAERNPPRPRLLSGKKFRPASPSAAAKPQLAVLHVALEPTSGVWSVMRDLSQAQVESGRYRAVAMGIIASSKWPVHYAEELNRLDLLHFRCKTLSIFGTAKFLWQRFHRPPIGEWADDLMQRSGSSSVVVHFHNAWLSGVFLPIQSTHKDRIKTVVTFHGVCTTLEREPVRRWLHRQMAQRLLRYGARLTSVDTGNLSLADKIFRLPPERFTVVPNGVQADPSLSAALWSGDGEFVVGYVGLLAEHKGWRIIADAVLKVRAGGRNVRLLIAGAGPEEAVARTEASAHPDAIEFMGYISAPRMEVMPKMHALSLMSTYEGLPMVLIEAASIGLPVIATAVGGVAEILEDGVTGMLISRSADSLALAIESLYDNPKTMFRMGQAARLTYLQRFEIAQVAGLYHSVYSKSNHKPAMESGNVAEKRLLVFHFGQRRVLAIPAQPRALHRLGVQRYQGHTSKRRAYQRLLSAAVSLGIQQVFSSSVPISYLTSIGLDYERWMDMLRERLGKANLYAVIVWPTQLERGRLYLHLFDDGLEPCAFVKISKRSKDWPLMETGFNALAELATLRFHHFRLPRPLGKGDFDGNHFVIQDALPVNVRPIHWTQDADVLPLVEELCPYRKRLNTAEIMKLSWWKGYANRLPVGCESFHKELLAGLAGGAEVGRVHGDFSPSNMAAEASNIWLFDWESSHPQGPSLTDVVGYFLSFSVGEVVHSPIRHVKRFERHFLDAGDQQHRLDVMLALAYRHSCGMPDAEVYMRHCWDDLN